MPRFPRLLLVSNFLSPAGGSKSVLEDLADHLRALTDRMICVSPYRSGWLRGFHMLSTALLRRPAYDLAIVDLYSGRAFLWGEAVSFLLVALRRPFILILHGGALPEFAQRYSRRVRNCLGRATVVAVPSRYLLEQMHPYRVDLRLLPNPIDLHRYEFKVRTHPQPRLIWLRAFHTMYNPSLAARMVSLLMADFPDLHLTMVGKDKGDGSLQGLEQVARALGVADRVSLPGGVPKERVADWISQGDIFLNTTNVDNTPVSILEAMACGLCVISTNVGGIPYLLEHEKDALLVPPDDPPAMAAAVRRVLTEPGLAARLSCNARRKAEAFDWAAILPHWEALLTAVAERHDR